MAMCHLMMIMLLIIKKSCPVAFPKRSGPPLKNSVGPCETHWLEQNCLMKKRKREVQQEKSKEVVWCCLRVEHTHARLLLGQPTWLVEVYRGEKKSCIWCCFLAYICFPFIYLGTMGWCCLCFDEGCELLICTVLCFIQNLFNECWRTFVSPFCSNRSIFQCPLSLVVSRFPQSPSKELRMNYIAQGQSLAYSVHGWLLELSSL